MREILHAAALTVVLAVAALCTLVQLSDVQHAFDQLSQDESVISPVSSDQRGPGQGAPGRR
jgi:hypothetical protein